jgi:hypothetical protein
MIWAVLIHSTTLLSFPSFPIGKEAVGIQHSWVIAKSQNPANPFPLRRVFPKAEGCHWFTKQLPNDRPGEHMSSIPLSSQKKARKK